MTSITSSISILLKQGYEKLFGHPIGVSGKKLFSYLSWSFIGGIFSAAIMFIFTTIVGNKMGPYQFGKYNYIISLATTISLLIIQGTNTGLTRFASETSNGNEKRNLFWGAISIIFINTIMVLIVYVIMSNLHIKSISFYKTDLLLASLAGLLIVFKTILDSSLKSFLSFKVQSFAKIIEASIVLVLLLIPIIYNLKFDYQYLIWILILGYLIYSLLSISNNDLLKNISTTKKHIVTLYQYNIVLLPSLLGSILFGLEKFSIGYFMGMENLGIYSAYYAVSQSILSTITIVFMNAYWPYLIQEKNNYYASIKKIKLLLLNFSPVWILAIFIMVNLFILLFGSAYKSNLLYSIIFSFSSYLNICWSIFANILLIKHAKKISIMSSLIPVLLLCSIILTRDILLYVLTQIIIYSLSLLYLDRQFKLEYSIFKKQ